MGPGKPGKSWNFVVAFFQDWKVLEKGYWSRIVLEICLTQVKNMKCGIERINVNFRVLEKSI